MKKISGVKIIAFIIDHILLGEYKRVSTMFMLVQVCRHIELLFICVVTEQTMEQIVEDVEHQANFESDSYLLFHRILLVSLDRRVNP